MRIEEASYPSCEEVCPYARQRVIGSSRQGEACREQAVLAALHQPLNAEALRVCQEIGRIRGCVHDAAVRPTPAGPPSPLSAFHPLGVMGWEGEKAFVEQSTALRGAPTLDLQDFLFRQSLVEGQWDRPEGRRALLCHLQREGHMRPARHFCYETSRNDEQYSQRLGFSFPDLVRVSAKPERKKVLLELGQGSGACMDGRRPYARTYMQVGCCDVLQYTVRDLLLSAIDRDALRQGIAGRLGRPDWQAHARFWRQLCTFAAKVLVIRVGGTDQNEVPFDEDALAALAADANALVEILRLKSPLLAQTDIVPASEGMPHPEMPGEFVYPRRDRKPSDPAFHAACGLLARDPAGHLTVGPGKKDVLDVLPVYPCGMMLGDFRDIIPRLRPGQVQVAVGIRSTQALDGDEYVSFMSGMTRLLTAGDTDDRQGIYVDDNARKNYGAHYPLEELREVERRTGFPIYVIRGRGPEAWECDVPVAVVATRSGAKVQFIADTLRPGFRMQRPGDMLNDAALMSRLPPRPVGHRSPPT